MTVDLFVFELLDDFLYVALGALLYSYSRQKDIVTRMTRVTRVERLPGEDERLPALLDIRRSSESV